MTQQSCCVSGCRSRIGSGFTLHAFPDPEKELERFRAWVMKVGGEINGLDHAFIHKNRKVCHRHFENIYVYSSKTINRLAVPTLHIPVVEPQSDPLPSTSHPSASQQYMSSSVNVVELQSDQFNSLPSTSHQSTSQQYMPSSVNDLHTHVPVQQTRKCTPKSKKSAKNHSTKAAPEINKNELELQKVILKTKAQLQRCEKTKAGYKTKLKLAKKVMLDTAYNTVTKHLSPEAKSFFQMQVKQCSKRPKGRRFTLNEKILALSLYKPSPKAYRLLSEICVLPHRRTLGKLMQKLSLRPGINEILFENLKKKVTKMPDSHRYCTVVFDEMALATLLNYNVKEDTIKGFCNDGSNSKPQFCDHALVFMVRGIFKKFKQPVAFSFCAGSTKSQSLAMQIKAVIEKVEESGLNVIGTVCDQGASNIAAINILLNETKEKYLKNGEEWPGDFFEITNHPIYPIFDPPHLIKGIRNNLLNKDLQFEMDGKKKVAKWNHIISLFKRGPAFKGVRLISKLTARHVIPNLIPKMRVKYCTQVFSRSVGVALGFMAGSQLLPPECTDTADLLMFFDEVFDSVNGNFSEPVKGKIYRSAVTPKSPHSKLWYRSLKVLTSMTFLTKKGKKATVPSIKSWVKTIKSFINITQYLRKAGLNSLLLRNFNQDPLENFFGAIRAHGQRNIMPSAQAFENSYRVLLVNNIVSPKSIGGNCEEDGTHCLQSLRFLLTQRSNDNKPKIIEIDEDHLGIELIDINKMLASRDRSEVEKSAAAAYCSGWMIHKLKKNIYKNCEICKNDLEGINEEEFQKFINMKKYNENAGLHSPTKCLIDFFLNLENICIEILKTVPNKEGICNYIHLVSTCTLNFNFLTCAEHRQRILEFLLRKGIVFIINNYCKDINMILSGKSVEYDEGDPMKSLANDYYKKNKCKK